MGFEDRLRFASFVRGLSQCCFECAMRYVSMARTGPSLVYAMVACCLSLCECALLLIRLLKAWCDCGQLNSFQVPSQNSKAALGCHTSSQRLACANVSGCKWVPQAPKNAGC